MDYEGRKDIAKYYAKRLEEMNIGDCEDIAEYWVNYAKGLEEMNNGNKAVCGQQTKTYPEYRLPPKALNQVLLKLLEGYDTLNEK